MAPWRIWEDDIIMDLQKININIRNCVDSAEDRNYWRALVNAVLNLLVPQTIHRFTPLLVTGHRVQYRVSRERRS